MEALKIQGRHIGEKELSVIRELIHSHPQWHRTRLSQELCRQWNWCNEAGNPKDMAARTLLRKLDQHGLITLPPPIRGANNAFRNRSTHSARQALLDLDVSPRLIRSPLSALQPITIEQATSPSEVERFRSLLQQYHYLGYSGAVGENLKYLAYSVDHEPLAALLFGASAWRVSSRDRWIGWSDEQHSRHLSRIANNSRFLIPAYVQVPHLASHLLAKVSRRISHDWTQKYGHPIHLLETFVERGRFSGTCYLAANWQCVGETTGRTRNSTKHRASAPIKTVWLYPLHRHAQRMLVA